MVAAHRGDSRDADQVSEPYRKVDSLRLALGRRREAAAAPFWALDRMDHGKVMWRATVLPRGMASRSALVLAVAGHHCHRESC